MVAAEVKSGIVDAERSRICILLCSVCISISA